MTVAAKLHDLVAALPEIYQPIYGHPELSRSVSRDCDDRLAVIAPVFAALAAAAADGLRVLDLGCAQGWFSLSLAGRGARVRGVDFNPANVAVCRELAGEFASLPVAFEVGDIAAVVADLAAGERDLTLGLSVFHHLCERHGKANVRRMLAELLAKTPHALLELALAGEPPAWQAALPDDPEYLLEPLPFFRVLSRHRTHLSAIERPLYFCSRTHWLLDTLAPFESWEACEGQRLYTGADKVAKLGRDSGAEAVAFTREEACLRAAASGPRWQPRLLAAGASEGRRWLVLDRQPGTPLDRLIALGLPFAPATVLRHVLAQLAAWEQAELFHRTLHAGRVVMGPDGRAGIHAAALGTGRMEWNWPQQPFVAFWAFAFEVLNRQLIAGQSLQPAHFRPANLPEPYARWSLEFWNAPDQSWNFARLLAAFPA